MTDAAAANNRFAILTLAIGADFRRDLVDCLESKRAYAVKHGYTYVQGGEEFWDRERPIAWSKIPFLLNFLKKRAADFDYIWFSDADVYITNPSIPLTEIAALMPAGTDLLLNVDAWHNVNSGNMLMRLGASGTTWLANYFSRVWERKADLYHIWYENKAMIDEYEAKPADKARIHFNKDHKRFNAYLNGRPGEPLWMPGDFLVHFAGIYNTAIMKGCVENIKAGGTPRIDAS
jgi:hypothetical protein